MSLSVQAGDQQLVKQVRTVALPGGDGVRIILDLIPGRPYTFWRSSRDGSKGGYQYMVGIKPDSQGGAGSTPGLVVDRRASTITQETAEAPPPPRTYPSERESTPPLQKSAPLRGEQQTSAASSEYQRPTSGEMGEIARLMPAAGPALGFWNKKVGVCKKIPPVEAAAPAAKNSF